MSEAIAAAIASGLISSAGQIYANSQNIDANLSRFRDQIDLANTAHQREVRDLLAAGLNPILSASGSGSAVPQLGAPEVGSISSQLGESVASAGRLAALDVPLKESQVALNSAQAENLRSDGVLKRVQADMVRRGIDTVGNSAGSIENATQTFGDWFGSKLGQIIQSVKDDSDNLRNKVSDTPRTVRHWTPKPAPKSEPKPSLGPVRPPYVPLSERKKRYVPLSERNKRK